LHLWKFPVTHSSWIHSSLVSLQIFNRQFVVCGLFANRETHAKHMLLCAHNSPMICQAPIICPYMPLDVGCCRFNHYYLSDETTAISCTCWDNLPANKTGWIWSFCRFKPPPQGVSLVWFFCFFSPEIVLVMMGSSFREMWCIL
jgi:hypothetical protein